MHRRVTPAKNSPVPGDGAGAIDVIGAFKQPVRRAFLRVQAAQFEIVAPEKDARRAVLAGNDVGRGQDFAVGLRLPKQPARGGVQGIEHSIHRAGKNGTARQQRRGLHRGAGFEGPNLLSIGKIHGIQIAVIGPDENSARADDGRRLDRAARFESPEQAGFLRQGAGGDAGQGGIAAEHRPTGRSRRGGRRCGGRAGRSLGGIFFRGTGGWRENAAHG